MPKILEIITEPNLLLHQKSVLVNEVTDKLRSLMQDMLVTMHHNNGIGLAAVQVSILKKVIVIELPAEAAMGIPMPLFMVNAEIIKKSDDTIKFKEGCLSVPGFFAEVTRSKDITIKFINYNGKEEILDIPHSLLAACIQHEIDHTNGIVFIDYLSKLKKDLAVKKVLKYLKKSQY